MENQETMSMEDVMKSMTPEQLKKARSEYYKRTTEDVKILELDARYWEAKLKAVTYRREFAKLEAIVQQELSEAEKMMQEEVLKMQEKAE